MIRAAAFGAFVPSIPVARVAVGPLDPGERREITAEVSRWLLDAIALRRLTSEMLDPDRSAEWIGNFDIFFERAPGQGVERHCAIGLRAPAGAQAVADFHVFCSSECVATVACSDPEWSASVRVDGFVGTVVIRVPPISGSRAKITVDVTRVSDQKTVPVELEIEAA